MLIFTYNIITGFNYYLDENLSSIKAGSQYHK